MTTDQRTDHRSSDPAIRAYARRIVDGFGPMTSDQRARVTELLRVPPAAEPVARAA